jgi:hypothetical protein
LANGVSSRDGNRDLCVCSSCLSSSHSQGIKR